MMELFKVEKVGTFDETTDPVQLYNDLLASGKLDTQRGVILRILKDLKPHYCWEFTMEGINQYNARIKELRAMGCPIVSKRDEHGNPYFILDY